MNRRLLPSALGLCATLAGAAPAGADVVTIGSKLDPEQARIVVGGKVRWENTTATAQRVDSIGRPAFDDLATRAGGFGERTFDRVGRYRYRVAGIRKDGEVVVRAAARRGSSSFAPADGGRGRVVAARQVHAATVAAA